MQVAKSIGIQHWKKNSLMHLVLCNYRCRMQLKNVTCNYFLVASDMCSYIGQVAKNIFFINELTLRILWASIDATHTLIDMVCTMLLLCM